MQAVGKPLPDDELFSRLGNYVHKACVRPCSTCLQIQTLKLLLFVNFSDMFAGLRGAEDPSAVNRLLADWPVTKDLSRLRVFVRFQLVI